MPKISQFPSGGVAQNTDLIPVVRNGGDYTITGYNLAALASYGQAYTGTFTATAGQTVFTLPASPGSLANLAISVDGAVMVPGTDYTWTTPTTLTFTSGLSNGQTVLYRYTTSVPVGTAIAGGVNGQLLYNNSGVVNGFSMSGDVTVVPTTGVATVNAPGTHITYTQGGTGATSRTVTSKLQESVSVLDFGADPTGTTDSTTAIQNAMTAGANGEVIVPYGTYKISTGPITVPTGTSVRFLGSAKFMHYGSGDCLSLQSVKDVSLYRPYVDLTNAGASAKGIAIRGGWYVNFYAPRVVGGNAGQSGIYIETSASAGANYGAYMIEIHNPDLGNNNGTGVLGYGIQTAQTASDTYSVTMLNVYGGWAKNCTYGMYLRNTVGFKIHGWTHDTGTDCINIDNSSDGVLSPGELGPATGYGINWGSGCVGMYLIAPNIAGVTPTLGFQNNSSFTPDYWNQGVLRLYGSRSDQTYYATLESNYSYGQSFIIRHKGSSSETIIFEAGEAAGTTVRGTISSGGVVKLSGKSLFCPKRFGSTYGATIAIDASTGMQFDISVTNGTAFAISNPTNVLGDGQTITITVRNTSGGVMGAITWDTLYKLAAWTNPANANSRSITFKWNTTNWVEIARTPADVPN